MTQGIERSSFDFGGMSGSKVIAVFARKQAAFLGVNLMPDCRFLTLVLPVYFILQTYELKHIFSSYKKLPIEPKHAFIPHLVPILQPLQNLLTIYLLNPVYCSSNFQKNIVYVRQPLLFIFVAKLLKPITLPWLTPSSVFLCHFRKERERERDTHTHTHTHSTEGGRESERERENENCSVVEQHKKQSGQNGMAASPWRARLAFFRCNLLSPL